nr:class I SAM-dependent methyltransferase [Selenomonas sp.]
LLHSITGNDEEMSDSFMRKYIFPGGMLPSLRELVSIAYDHAFRVQDVESLRRHYYKTLLCWYKNFQAVHEKVKDWKGKEFVRMWDIYLVGCAAAFYTGYIDIHQVLMTKGTNNELPMTRWY